LLLVSFEVKKSNKSVINTYGINNFGTYIVIKDHLSGEIFLLNKIINMIIVKIKNCLIIFYRPKHQFMFNNKEWIY